MSFQGNGTSAYMVTGTVSSPATWSFHCFYKGNAAPSSADAKRPVSIAEGIVSGRVDCGLIWDNTVQPQQVFVASSGGSYYGAVFTSTLSGGMWYGMGGRLDAVPNVCCFLNGAKQATTAAGAPSTTGHTPTICLLAAYSGVQEWDNGTIAEFAFWNTNLTDAEMNALGLGVCPLLIRPQSLVTYAPLLGNVNAAFGKNFVNSGCISQPHTRIYRPKVFDTRRLGVAPLITGELSNNVNLQSVFTGGQLGLGSFADGLNLESQFEVVNTIQNNINFSGVFSTAEVNTPLSSSMQFKSQFTANVGALATGRFRGLYYG